MTHPTAVPTETPTTTAGPQNPVFDTPFSTPPPSDIHKDVDDVVAQERGEEEQFWISIDTHQMLIVSAPNLEAAIAKAVVNFDGLDPDIEEVTRDVHTCAHGSEDAHDKYGAHAGEEEEE